MEEHIAHSGAWGIALVVIVLVSWFLYRYLAPKTCKEWAGAVGFSFFCSRHLRGVLVSDCSVERPEPHVEYLSIVGEDLSAAMAAVE